MNAENLPLANIRLLEVPAAKPPADLLDPPTLRGTKWLEHLGSLAVAERSARDLGATCVAVPTDAEYAAAIDRNYPGSYLARANLWFAKYTPYIEEMFFATGRGREISRPDTRVLARCDMQGLFSQLENGTPFMIADPLSNRGHMKYLIEHAWQLQRVWQFCADHERSGWLDRLEYRQYILTPSKHYTSFRTNVTPGGTILAGGLLYSAQTRDGPRKVITNDRFYDVDPITLQAKQAFENPASPYYLAATDVRSNANMSRERCIPLMGPGADGPLTQTEADLLRAHGIDPYNRRLPVNVAKISVTVGAHMRPALDIITGIDIFLRAGTLEAYYGERNPDPGEGTYARCYPDRNAVIDMRLTALRSLQTVETMRPYRDKIPYYDPAELDWVPLADGPHSPQLARINDSGWVALRTNGRIREISPPLKKQFFADLKAGKYDFPDAQNDILIGILPCEDCSHPDPWRRYAHQELRSPYSFIPGAA